ncbi:MAG: D-alanyl-D-alanine carboxypeptidase [Myxococcota bacterium]
MRGLRCAALLGVAGLVTACADDGGGTPAATEGSDSGGSPTSGDGADDAVPDDGSSDGESGPTPGDSDDTTTGGPLPDPGDPFDPPPPLPTLPQDVIDALGSDINAILDGGAVGGFSQSVLIVDAETGQEVFAKNPDLLLKPASNTKLLTTAIAIEALGAEHRFLTEVRADAQPDAQGNVAGDLHVVVHHDFTWSTQFQVASDLVLDRIASDLFDLGLRTVGGTVIVHGEAVFAGEQFGTYNAAAHRNLVAATMATSLSQAGVTVSGGSATAADFEQPGELLYAWRSPPLSVAAAPTNIISHNEFADVFARHVGFELEGESSYAAEETALLAWLSSIPTPTDGIAINDGSGLSHDNRISARTIVDMLGFMAEQPDGLAWVRTFSISGVRGTLGGRMLGADVWGRVWGKTGTLTGVIATSGVLYNRHDGRRYHVGQLFNDVTSNAAARGAHDNIFGVMGGDHYGTPRPAAPVLASVRAADSDIVEIEWSAVDGATGYLVWVSPDGRTWNRGDARLVEGTTHRAGDLPFGPDVYVRVTAVSDAGESDASDTYGSRSESGQGRVLVVDGFDRWQAEPISDNPLGGAHDFVAEHGTAIDGAAIWDSCANDAVVAGDVSLADYDAVIWLLGEESTEHETFDSTEQDLVTEYLDAGGNLMVSGAEIGWDLVENGDPADAAFFSEMLHADYLGDESAAWFIDGVAGPFADLGTNGVYTPGTIVAGFTDQLEAGPDAEAVAAYYGGFGGTAAVSYDGEHRVLLLGFPFSAIDNAEAKRTLMTSALDSFGL